MGNELQIFAEPGSVARPIGHPIDIRARRILDMKISLIEIFGGAAFAIALSQPNERDVGGESGIRWHDIVAAFRSA